MPPALHSVAPPRPAPANPRDLLAAFDLMGFGSILVDGEGRILGRSGRALALWFDLFGDLDAVTPEQTAVLKTLVGEAAAAGHSGQPCLPVALSRSRKRAVIVHAAMMIEHPPDTDAAVAAVLMLFNPDEARELSAPFLRGAFGLTKSEIALARYLCLGKSLKEVARVRETSVATLRVQLRVLFAKTQTKRQAELVALLCRLPPHIELMPRLDAERLAATADGALTWPTAT